MSTGPSMKLIKQIRDDPDPALAAFVEQDLEYGKVYPVATLWFYYNGRCGYGSSSTAFKYALTHAGMVAVRGGMTRTPL